MRAESVGLGVLERSPENQISNAIRKIIHTSLLNDEVMARLKTETASKKPLFRPTSELFVGTVDDRTFGIWGSGVDWERFQFVAKANGKVEEVQDGSRITVDYSLRRDDRIYIAAFVLASIGAFSVVFSAAIPHASILAILIALLVAGFGSIFPLVASRSSIAFTNQAISELLSANKSKLGNWKH